MYTAHMNAEKENCGTLVISLDLELYWGMFDKVSIDAYGEHIRGVHEAVPKMLALFSEYEVHTTWAAVGMMTCSSREELESLLPAEEKRPTYASASISAYAHLHSGAVGTDEGDDPYHFGGSIIRAITETEGQEVGSHTFSHYYALEAGQTKEQFAADLAAERAALERYGAEPRSLVFARNQVNRAYFPSLTEAGVTCYRGSPDHPLYRARSEKQQTGPLLRGCRFLDRYLPLSGHYTYALEDLAASGAPFNIPASRQLNPYARGLRVLESLKLWRIKRGMRKAARRGELYHIWWHPHNFGVDQEENLAELRALLAYFKELQKQYGMRSRSMGEVARELEATTEKA